MIANGFVGRLFYLISIIYKCKGIEDWKLDGHRHQQHEQRKTNRLIR